MNNPLLRTVAPSQPSREERYGLLNLRENPFPLQPSLVPGSQDPRTNGNIYCEDLYTDKEMDFKRLLIPGPNRDEPRSIAFLMDYATRRGRGIGKSAFLNHQKTKILRDLGEEASEGTGVIFAVHVTASTSPSCRKFWEFCRLITESLIDQEIVWNALLRLRALSGHIPQEVLDQIGGPEEWTDTIGSNNWLNDKGIATDFVLKPALERTLIEAGVNDLLSHDLAFCNSSDELRERLLRRYTQATWRNQGGRLVFHDLVRVFVSAKFTRGLLLVDEVEKIVYHQSTVERRAFVESCRYYLVDGECANTQLKFYGMLLTIHPGIQEILLPHWKSAGLDRLAPLAQPDAKQSTIYFPPLNQSMARPLVRVYLDQFRIKPQASIAPFEEDAVVEALTLSGGVPGPTLKLLHQAIEAAVEQQVTSIDVEFIRSVRNAGEQVEAGEIEDMDAVPDARVNLMELER